MTRGLWFALAAACAEPSAPSVEGAALPATGDPIRIERGSRTLEVRCVEGCAGLEAELERLAAACRRDPLSTPHAAFATPAAVALGCCEEASSAHRDACGDETSAACASGWRARCGAAALAEVRR